MVACAAPAAVRSPACRWQQRSSVAARAAQPGQRRWHRRAAAGRAAASGGGEQAGGDLELPKPRKPSRLEPSYWLSREEAVEAQLKVRRPLLRFGEACRMRLLGLGLGFNRRLPSPLAAAAQALKHNNFPTLDHGIETLYKFAGFDPWDRSSCESGCMHVSPTWPCMPGLRCRCPSGRAHPSCRPPYTSCRLWSLS